MNRTIRLADAITRHQRRESLTPAEVARELETTEEGIARLHRWNIEDFEDRDFHDVVDTLADATDCRDTEGLAIILLQAVELVDA